MSVLIALTTLVGTATVASAEGAGYVTMWEDNYYTGNKYIDYPQGASPDDRVEIHWWNGDNEISSVKNRTTKWLVLYDNDGWTGQMLCLAPGSFTGRLRNLGFDNKAESFQLRDVNPCR